jgi:hypothetical protein
MNRSLRPIKALAIERISVDGAATRTADRDVRDENVLDRFEVVLGHVVPGAETDDPIEGGEIK